MTTPAETLTLLDFSILLRNFGLGIGSITAVVISIYFAGKREWRRDQRIKTKGAHLIRNELETLARHSRDNLRKIISMWRSGSFGNPIDIQKFYYHEDGFLTISLESVSELDPNLATTVFRLSLFQRNTEWHIQKTIEATFPAGRASEFNAQSRQVLGVLFERMWLTRKVCRRLCDRIIEYEKAPDSEMDFGDIIPAEFFQLDEDKGGLTESDIDEICNYSDKMLQRKK